MVKSQRISVGDRVKILRGNHRSGPYKYLIGQEGTVVRISFPRNVALATVRFDDGNKFACYEDEMELVLAETEEL